MEAGMQGGVNDTSGRVAGGALAAASALVILVMAHHPTGQGHTELNQMVHGAMIMLIVLILAGYAKFYLGRATARFSNLVALMAYGLGAVANVLAATINGFAAPAAFDAGTSSDVLMLYWELNQALAYVGVYGTSLAFGLWGLDLLRERGVNRFVGVLGLIAGALPIALLATEALTMRV